MPEAAAKEHYTPGQWKIGKNGNTIFVDFPSSQLWKKEDWKVIASVTKPEDARLIVEAPFMFPLFKEFVRQHAEMHGGNECDCFECKAAKAIIVRVNGG